MVLAVVLLHCDFGLFFFFFKQKTAYEIGTGDWSSDVSSDLGAMVPGLGGELQSDIDSEEHELPSDDDIDTLK